MSNKENLRDSRLLKAFRDEQMKVYVEKLGDGRVKAIYEAHADTDHNQKCIKTIFVYTDSTDDPIYTIEKQALWDGQWDVDAEAAAVALGYTLES